jgi:hypothetical protein
MVCRSICLHLNETITKALPIRKGNLRVTALHLFFSIASDPRHLIL